MSDRYIVRETGGPAGPFGLEVYDTVGARRIQGYAGRSEQLRTMAERLAHHKNARVQELEQEAARLLEALREAGPEGVGRETLTDIVGLIGPEEACRELTRAGHRLRFTHFPGYGGISRIQLIEEATA